MNSPYEKVTCLASVELGWPAADCHGPEFSVSEADPELRACVNCIALCIDKLKLERDELHYDTVTGIPNRQAFDKTFSRMAGRGNDFGLMILDIDGFKRANDALGHPQGDDVLRLLAQTVETQLRPLDQVFRIGGDEFAAILVTSDTHGDIQEDDICNRVEQAFIEALNQAKYPADLKLGVSVGMGFYSGGDGYDFLNSVDKKMYAHKESKKQTQSTEVVDLRKINSTTE